MAQDNRPSQEEDKKQEVAQYMRYRRLLKKKRRIEREAEGEIEDLNITPMMDMMTIILVFLLKSYSSTGINIAADVSPPMSHTRLPPKDTVSITVTRCAPDSSTKCRPGDGFILVLEKQVLAYQDDHIPAELKENGENGMLILPLYSQLQKEVEKAKTIAQWNPSSPFTGELSIIADKKMPYRLLTEILYTAGQAELDSYRFVVIQKEGDG